MAKGNREPITGKAAARRRNLRIAGEGGPTMDYDPSVAEWCIRLFHSGGTTVPDLARACQLSVPQVQMVLKPPEPNT
jgi:hypothetical protein